MDPHDNCADSEFCLSPLHPGPCKGSGKGAKGGGGAKKKAVKKAAVKKAAAPKKGSPEAIGANATEMAKVAIGVDSKKWGADLQSRLAGAPDDDARRQILTNAAIDIGKVIANGRAPKASPKARRALAAEAARLAHQAMVTGNQAPLRLLISRLAGEDTNDDDIRAAIAGRTSDGLAGEVAVFAARKNGKMSAWKGLLAPIGKPTGDGRMFAPDALTNRDLPLPLRFQRSDGGGHGGAVVVGRILSIEYGDDGPYARGDWLDPKITPEVTEAQEWSRKGVVGPSVDLDDAVMEMVPADAAEAALAGECGCGEADPDLEMAADGTADQPMIRLVTKGRISGATLVQIPAFAECHALEMSDEDDPDALAASGTEAAEDDTFEPAAGDPVTLAGLDGEPDDTAYFVVFSEDNDDEAVIVRDNAEVQTVAVSRLSAPAPDEAEAWSSDEAWADEASDEAWAESLLASGTREDFVIAAAVDGPPAVWFDNPGLPGPTPLTVTQDGRVFGHLAKWGTCHVGLPGCVTPPTSRTSYAFFHTGEVVSREGRTIEVGKVTLGTGHADPEAGFRAAADHYDHSGACVAVVRAGEDEYGIWVAGSTTPECDATKLAALRRSPLSGDWRRIGANLELVAALAVNVPGFPVPRSRVASGRAMSLVAGGVVREAEHGHAPAVDVEATFHRLMQRRDTFHALIETFAEADRARARMRVRKAAGLLAVLDD